jgi:DNA-binding PadR family transcriptional regulator
VKGAPASVSLLGNAILQRLMRRRMSGYELKKLFTTPLGYGWRAYDTQIYRELKVLEQAGLVSGEDEEGRAGPQRRVYSVTPAGEDALLRWLQSPLDETGRKSELTMRVWSMDLMPLESLLELLASVREQTVTTLNRMTSRRDQLREEYGPPELVEDPQHVGRLLVLEQGIEEAQHKLRWLERVEAVARVRALLNEPADQPPRLRLVSES